MVYKGPGVVKEMKELISILKKEKLKNIVKQSELILDPSLYFTYIATGKTYV